MTPELEEYVDDLYRYLWRDWLSRETTEVLLDRLHRDNEADRIDFEKWLAKET